MYESIPTQRPPAFMKLWIECYDRLILSFWCKAYHVSGPQFLQHYLVHIINGLALAIMRTSECLQSIVQNLK